MSVPSINMSLDRKNKSRYVHIRLLSVITDNQLSLIINFSRVFAISRHFQPYEYELNRNNNYHDDKEVIRLTDKKLFNHLLIFQYIYSHSGSLLSFTNLDEIDAKLLPIFLEKVRTGKNR